MNDDASTERDEILVVDDTKGSLQLLSGILNDAGYKVRPASDGETALRSAKARPPGLVLLDIKMPGMDGLEVCRRLKSDEKTRGVPVILISILEDKSSKTRGFQAGAVDYVAKPFYPEEVLARVKTHLSIHRLHSKLKSQNETLLKEIEERGQTELRLRESENRFRAQYQGSPMPTFTWQRRDEDFVLIDCNLAAVEITQGRAQQYLGRSANEMYQNRPEIREDLHRCLAEKTVIGKELVSQDFMPGRYVLTNYAFVPPDLVMVHVNDMTARRESEAAIRESEAQKKAILDASIDRIRLVDRDLRIIWANKTTTSELNIAPEELKGKICYEFFVEGDAPCPGCPMIKALKSGRIEHAVMHHMRSKGIGDSYWDTYGVPIKDESGNIVNLIEITRNITEKKKAERETERLEAQLRHAQKMEAISTLAGGIAHDFNNILSGIMGYGQLAQMELDPDSEPYADLKEVLRSANRARLLIRQILAIGRSQEQERRQLQLKPIVKEALKFLRSTLPSTIEIQKKIDKDVGVIHADATQMHQVLMNLCTNAGHAMVDKAGILEVRLQNAEIETQNAELNLAPGGYLKLTVSDTGHGMTPEVMEKIFDPYFTTKDPGVGTGIGLSVVHGIIEQHGGAIRVESEEGKGSTFHVYLPLTGDEEKKPQIQEETQVPRGHERILFIDDEATLARLGKEMLQGLGYDVTAMTSSLEALALFRQDPKQFDLVITDTTMPHMPGDVLAQELMKIRPDIPVIICTGHSKRISLEKAKAIGIKELLMKPVNMKDLAKTVKKALEGQGKDEGRLTKDEVKDKGGRETGNWKLET